MSRWSVGRWPTSAKIKSSFHGGPSSHRSNAFRFVPRTPECWHSWVQVFPVPLEKKLWVPQISVSQSVDHCDIPSGAAPRVLWQQCQTVMSLAVVTDQPVWFFHLGNADSSQSAPDDSNSVGVLHGCRPSSSVVFCNECVVAKRCKIGPRLLLITNRKSNTGFQMTLKSLTLDDLEGS